MSIEKLTKYTQFARPALFAFALLLHVLIIFLVSFNSKNSSIETVKPKEEEIFKLVDIQEYIEPPKIIEEVKPPVIEKKPEVKEEAEEVVTVSNQPKASENIEETDKTVEEVFDEGEYLPQHKISSIPVIPTKDILSRIEYPPMALKQGIEAVVYLELYIDSKGIIKNIRVLKDPGYGFAQAAVNALNGISCIPAVVNGKACSVKFRYPVKFTIN